MVAMPEVRVHKVSVKCQWVNCHAEKCHGADELTLRKKVGRKKLSNCLFFLKMLLSNKK